MCVSGPELLQPRVLGDFPRIIPDECLVASSEKTVLSVSRDVSRAILDPNSTPTRLQLDSNWPSSALEVRDAASNASFFARYDEFWNVSGLRTMDDGHIPRVATCLVA